jgi:hypothetical protein
MWSRKGGNMNGYYRRRSGLPFEEVRPLEINEIEFVSDVGEHSSGEGFIFECPICGDEAFTVDDETYCKQCCWENEEDQADCDEYEI